MRRVIDFRLFLFLATAFTGFYFGDTQFSQASENTKPTREEINLAQNASVASQCVQLSGSYALDSASSCTDDTIMPDFIALGCSTGAVLPGQKLVIEQSGCEKVILKAFSSMDEKNEHPLSMCEISMNQGEANRTIAEELFSAQKNGLEVVKSSQRIEMKKKSLRSQIFFKASVDQSPIKVHLKGGLKISKDGSLIFKTIKARKSAQIDKIQSACTLRRI